MNHDSSKAQKSIRDSNKGTISVNEKAAKGIVALVFVQLGFATLPLFGKLVLRHLTPDQLILLRCTMATLIFLAVLTAQGKSIMPRKASTLKLLAVCGLLGIAFNQIFFFWGLKYTTSIHATLLQILIPVFTLMLAVLLKLERFSWYIVASILLAASGVLVLFLDEIQHQQLDTGFGDALIVVNTLSFAGYLVLSKYSLKQVDALRGIFWTFAFGTSFLAIYFVFRGNTLPTDVPNSAWMALAYIILVPTVLVYLLNLWALDQLNPSTVGLFIYLQPIAATTLGFFVLKEPLTANFILAGCLIGTGLWLSQKRHRRKK